PWAHGKARTATCRAVALGREIAILGRQVPRVPGMIMAFRPSVPPRSSVRPPAINLPPLTLALLAAMAVIYVGLGLAPAEFERRVIVYFAFIPAAYTVEGWPVWSLIAAPFSYALLHGSLGHLVL